MAKSWRDISRDNWSTTEPDEVAVQEKTKLGSLQRIADACEQMAGNYTCLQNEVDWYSGEVKRLRADRDFANRRIAALQGVITKMKRWHSHGQG